jgi:hypothetical protein
MPQSGGYYILFGTCIKFSNYYSYIGEKPYECPVCGQKFAQRYNMRTHLKGHNAIQREPKQSFACPICSSKFSKKVKLNVHLTEVHDKADVSYPDQFSGDPFLEDRDLSLGTESVEQITDDYEIMNF